MFKLNLKIALRNLWKKKGFTLINVGGLALGLACCLMLLLYVAYEWNYDKQFKDADRIYVSKLNLKINGQLITTNATPTRLAGAALQNLPAVNAAARITSETNNLYSYKQNNYKLIGINADPAFLKIFNYKFLSGNPETALLDPNEILLTASAAKKLFGAEDPVGKSILWDNRKPLKVSAVIEDIPKNESIQFEVLQPWAFYEYINPDVKNNGWGSISCMTLLKLKDKNSFAQTDASLRKMIASYDKGTQLEAFLFPFAKYHLYNEFANGKQAGGRIDQVMLFIFLAICVLVIACINYMNLSTASSEKRAREVGVRKALGSTRKNLMLQFVLESMLLSLLAMCLAFALLELSLPYFNNLLNISINITYNSYLFWLVLAGLTILTGFLAGSYPAFYLSSFIPVKVLKGSKGNAGGYSMPIRKILVVFQFGLSVCMIIGAIIIYSQIQYIKNRPLGFNQQNLVEIDLEGEWAKPGKLDIFKRELIKANAITTGTQFASSFTRGGSITGDISWPGKAANDSSIINYRGVGYDFSATIGAKILAGRDFSPAFVADTVTSILLNKAAVVKMGLKTPIGALIHWGDNPPLTVVGVVDDYSNEAQGAEAKPTIYYFDVKTTSVFLMRLNPEQPLNASVAAIKRIGQQLNPAYPVELRFINQQMEEKLSKEQLLSILSNLFGGFAIFISCLGLLGLALYMAEQRSKEISIRKVLGANMRNILLLLNKDFLKLVFIANLIACPVAYILLKNWLQQYDYRINITAWPFIAAILISIFIALCSVSIQSFKVAKAKPVDALKYE